ncbi:MAG TPA: 2,3-bisphosphoglycerate-independent phosphoglycerate mutase [Thermofilum sp.]|nr:2,3-bisphosphoglycerate-independent phosphoglycerate mutase [Thermofilum sp.]
MKLLYLVIDGAADSLNDKVTSYEAANTPGLDKIASLSLCGLMYTISRGVAPESDAAVLSILSYDPHKYYTGRGPLEALGAGIRIKEGYEVAFRANFATLDISTGNIVDRRVGRNLKSDEARELAKALNDMDLGKYEGYAKVVATIGHRAVVVIGSSSLKLSDNVDNTDPAYTRKGKISVARPGFEPRLVKCRPLDDTEEAKRTAELVNIFTEKAIKILDTHPVNLKRASKGYLKANTILLRDAGGELPHVEPISRKFGIEFGAIVEMPVEIGIARLLGMEIEKVPPPTPDKRSDYTIRLKHTLDLLKRVDAVYVHLKGPDEPGHDGDFKGKVKSLEDIDEYFVTPLLNEVDLNNTAILVTSDHATPYSARTHTDDPVPVLLYVPGRNGDGISKLSESNCSKGSLGIIEHGWELLPKVINLLKK